MQVDVSDVDRSRLVLSDGEDAAKVLGQAVCL
jgi:hypothetical protein